MEPKEHEKCDKRKSHISSKLRMVHISSNNVDTLLLRLSLHFTPLYFTCRHFTSSHLNFTQLHFTTLSFGLTPFKLHPTTLHYPLVWLNPI